MTNNIDNRCPECGGITRVKDSKGKPCACCRACLKTHKQKRNAQAAERDNNTTSKKKVKKDVKSKKK